MGVTLAAMLGQIGLPGGGFGQRLRLARLRRRARRSARRPADAPAGREPGASRSSRSRASPTCCSSPGEPFDYDGQRLTYPTSASSTGAAATRSTTTRTWPGCAARSRRPDTIVVHEPFWTPMARHADIVLPGTMTLERNDIGGSPNDAYLIAMHQAVEPYAQARSDYAIFADLAGALGVGERFTEGRDEMAWLRHLYEGWREQRRRATGRGCRPSTSSGRPAAWRLPDADARPGAARRLPRRPGARAARHAERRASRSSRRRSTASATTTAPATRRGCEPDEWLGAPLAAALPAPPGRQQPDARACTASSTSARSARRRRSQGREPIRMHPADAAARGIRDGDVVRVFNDRGQLPRRRRRHRRRAPARGPALDGRLVRPAGPGGPRRDVRPRQPERAHLRSRHLAGWRQGCSGQHALVEVERWTGPAAADPRLRSAARVGLTMPGREASIGDRKRRPTSWRE